MNYDKAVSKALDNPLQLALGAALIIGVVYYLGRKTVKDVAAAAGGIVSGNNAITQNQTNAAGEKVTAYEGRGVVGTLGAAVNSVSGGTLASLGEKIGGGLFSLFGPKDTTPKTFYSVRFPDGKTHAVGDTWIDKNGYFYYPQGGTVRYKLGTLSGVRVATKAAA